MNHEGTKARSLLVQFLFFNHEGTKARSCIKSLVILYAVVSWWFNFFLLYWFNFFFLTTKALRHEVAQSAW
jgi:hypothetical protein